MLLLRELNGGPGHKVLPCNRTAFQERCIDAAFLRPPRQLYRQQRGFPHRLRCGFITSHAAGGWRSGVAPSVDSTTDDDLSVIQTSLVNLQQLVSNLSDDSTTDGLLSAYQQLFFIQRQALQEQRKQQTAIARSRWRSVQRAGKAPTTQSAAHIMPSHNVDMQQGVVRPEDPEAPVNSSSAAATATLLKAKQLRQRCDDAQDYLLSLLQLYLQDAPPSGVVQLLTSAASRHLNVTAINQACVNVFLEKQADAEPGDMAALMRALALVRCCSRGTHGVEGLSNSQLAALFAGTMSHLIAHVDKALQQNSYSEQQVQNLQALQHCTMPPSSNSSITRTRSRRQRPAPAAGQIYNNNNSSKDGLAVSTPSQPVVETADLRREVAAAVAAHVSGRVPLCSALIPHILRLLGDEAPCWLHPITDLHIVSSVRQLQDMISHPSRYDHTYLAAALHKLAELTEQQRWHAATSRTESDQATGSELLLASRLARRLFGRLQHLQEDASAAELVCVLAAAAKMCVTDGKVYAAAAKQIVDGPQLQQATDAHLASVMYAVACFSSSSSGRSSEASFGRQQQQYVLKQCAYHMSVHIRQQQAQQQEESSAQTANVVMAVWALATAGLRIPKVITTRLFEFLAADSSVHALLGSALDTGIRTIQQQQQQQQQVRLEEAARNSCTVLWAAAQLQYTHNMPMIKTYLAAFLKSLPAVSLTCNSVTTVLQALGTVLAAQQQQQQQDQDDDADYWRSAFLRCTDNVLERLQQQQQQSVAHGLSSVSSASATGGHAADGVCGVTAACQLVWAHQAAGMTLPERQLMQLFDLLQEQAPAWLLETAISRADSPQAILNLLQSPAAAALDLACIAAAFNRLVSLRDQHAAMSSTKTAQVTAPAAAKTQVELDTKAYTRLVKDCAKQVSTHAEAAEIPCTLQRQQQQHGDCEVQAQQQELAHRQQGASPAALASATAGVLWATAQLQHKDTKLCSRCMQLFHTVAQSASADAAAAVINAMAAAGRGLCALYKDQGLLLLQDVVRVCTNRLLTAQHPAHSQSGSKQGKRKHTDDLGAHAAACNASDQASLLTVAVAQNILQLHATLQMQQPSQQQLRALLTAVTDETALAAMKDNEITASLVAVLSSVAQVSRLPASSAADTADDGQQAVMQAAEVSEQQQLLQDLLMHGLLPRLVHATPKQIATSLEAVTELAMGPLSAATTAVQPCLVKLSLARDFTRAVFGELLAPSVVTSRSTDNRRSSSADMIGVNLPAGWKGEHLASVATALMRLGVSCAVFFEAVQADLLWGFGDASDLANADGDAQQPSRKARAQNVQLQHLVAICCSATALHFRVEQLLLQAYALAQAHLKSLSVAATTAAASCERRWRRRTQAPQQGQQIEASHLLLLAWCAAVMDSPKAIVQAKQLVSATLRASMRGLLVPVLAPASAAGSDVPRDLLYARLVFNTPGVAARMFQLHVWLADRQVQAAQQEQPQYKVRIEPFDVAQTEAAGDGVGSSIEQVAGASILAAEAEFSLGLGLSDLMSHNYLQKAARSWTRLQLLTAASAGSASQTGAVCWQLGAVAGSLQQLAGVEGLRAMSVSSDGWVVMDLEARIRDIPVAVLLLRDSEGEDVTGRGTYAAQGWLQEPQLVQDAGEMANQEQAQHPAMEIGAEAAGTAGTCPAAVVDQQVSTLGVLQQCLEHQHIGDVFFRARALAARGYWVVIVSCQEWSSLGSVPDAELAYLKDKLWLLLQDDSAEQAQHRVSSGIPVAAAALFRNHGQAVDLEFS